MDSIPGRGGKIPHAVVNSQEIKKKKKTLKDDITGRRKRCCASPGLENQVENLSLVLSENILPKYVRYTCAVTPENKTILQKRV